MRKGFFMKYPQHLYCLFKVKDQTIKMKKLLFCCLFTALAFAANAQEFTKTSRGASYYIYTHNSGEKIKLNDVITFNAIEKTDKDSVLLDSRVQGQPFKVQVRASANVGDLMDIFPLLTVKDSVVIKVPADSILKGHEDQRPPFLKPGSNLVFVIRIERVQSLQDAMNERNAAMAAQKEAVEKLRSEESLNAAKYIAENKLILKTTPTGLKYVVTHPTLKRKPLDGDTLLVNYTGRSLDGKVFDSSVESVAKEAGLQQPGRTYEPYKVVAGHGEVIQGWNEGLLLLNEGSKAKFIIPSKLAYGETGQGEIKPFSTLVFDLELVKIIPGKHPVVKHIVKKKKGVTHSAAKK